MVCWFLGFCDAGVSCVGGCVTCLAGFLLLPSLLVFGFVVCCVAGVVLVYG